MPRICRVASSASDQARQTGSQAVRRTTLPCRREADVRYGSKADISARLGDVRLCPQKRTLIERVGMSALGVKADVVSIGAP
jgi:hypothetical protein